eukprot:358386-Chlamydomonas_euryale.AAC.4
MGYRMLGTKQSYGNGRHYHGNRAVCRGCAHASRKWPRPMHAPSGIGDWQSAKPLCIAMHHQLLPSAETPRAGRSSLPSPPPFDPVSSSWPSWVPVHSLLHIRWVCAHMGYM